jgi:hypothetical protein
VIGFQEQVSNQPELLRKRAVGRDQLIADSCQVPCGGSKVEMRRHDTYCSDFSCSPVTLTAGLRPKARYWLC